MYVCISYVISQKEGSGFYPWPAHYSVLTLFMFFPPMTPGKPDGQSTTALAVCARIFCLCAHTQFFLLVP